MNKPNLEVFSETLQSLAENDQAIMVVTSDSRGSGKLVPFGQRFPEQIVEVGIAEQNLVGVAAGMASMGKKTFAVSPACFLTARSLEQIKNDVCYSDNPVKLVGISAGVSYGALGTTHHSLHDFAVLRAIHNITIVAPSDNFETREAIRQAAEMQTPIYLRFGKKNMPDILSDKRGEIGEVGEVKSEGRRVISEEREEKSIKDTHHSSLITHHSIKDTHHSSLITHHSINDSHHSSLITHHSIKDTHHSSLSQNFTIGKGRIIRQGSDLTFIACGEGVLPAFEAAEKLAKENQLECCVISMHTIKPLDTELISTIAKNGKPIITVEEHSVNGGLGEAIASYLFQNSFRNAFKIVGLPDEHTVSGSQKEIFEHYGISKEGLSKIAEEVMSEK